MHQIRICSVLSGTLAVVCMLASVPALGARSESDADLFPDPVVARGKGFEIKRSQVQDSLRVYKANMAAAGKPVSERQRAGLESAFLKQLIITQILTDKASAEEKTKAKEDVDKFLSKAQKNNPDLLEAEVKASGMSMDHFVERTLEKKICERVLDRELRSKIVVKEEEIEQFYNENPRRFEFARAGLILVLTIDKASGKALAAEEKKKKETLLKELKARAEKGEDFAALAKEYSEDPAAKDNGGTYTFVRGRSQFPEVEAAAFSMKPNQISDLVETPVGYQIIKLSEIKKVPLSEASKEIREYLVDLECQKQIEDYLQKLQNEAAVEILGNKPGRD